MARAKRAGKGISTPHVLTVAGKCVCVDGAGRLKPMLDEWFQPDGMYAWTIGIRGLSTLFASPR